MAQIKNAFKIVIIGSSSVGKSAFMHRIITRGFNSEIKPTVPINFSPRKLMLGDIEITLAIWDVGGMERFLGLLSGYCLGAKGAIVIFDLSYKEDYLKFQKRLEIFRGNARADAPFIIIGNKLDLIEPEYRKEERNEIQQYAQSVNSSYIEISVKTGYNVTAAFNTIINLILSKFGEEKIKPNLPFDFTQQLLEVKDLEQYDLITINAIISEIKSLLQEGLVIEAEILISVVNNSINKVEHRYKREIVESLENLIEESRKKTQKTLISNKKKIHSLVMQGNISRCTLHEELNTKCMKISKIQATICKPKILGFLMYQFPKKSDRIPKDYKEEIDTIIELINEVNKSSNFKIKTPSEATGIDVKTCDFCRIARSYDFGILLLSPPNPNAYLEAGMFLSLGKKVILLNNESRLSDAPFDLTPFFYINYQDVSELENNWNNKVIPFLQSLERTYLA